MPHKDPVKRRAYLREWRKRHRVYGDSPEDTEKRRLKNIRNLGTGLLGKKHSEETKRKIGESQRGSKGNNFGKHPTLETRIKMSRPGEKNPQWLGGLSAKPYSLDWTVTLKKSIKERDGYLCQVCGSEGTHVHHKDYCKTHNDPNNLITLCLPCHLKTNFNRVAWELFFTDVSAERVLGGQEG